jgi:hypothetical protein
MIFRVQKTRRVIGSRSRRALISACLSKFVGAPEIVAVCINMSFPLIALLFLSLRRRYCVTGEC